MTQIKKTFGGQLEEKLNKISELNEKNAFLESEIGAIKEQATVANEKEKRESELHHEEEKRNLEVKIAELENSLKNNTEKVKKRYIYFVRQFRLYIFIYSNTNHSILNYGCA